MKPTRGALVSRVLHGWCAGAAALTVLAGIGVLAGGWGSGTDTAIAFVLCGAALWARRQAPAPRGVRTAADAAAGLAAVIAVLSLAPRVSGLGLGGRMAPLTALCFLMVAAGLLSLDRDRVFPTGQRLAVASGFIALLSVAASAYGAEAVKPMDVFTATTLVVLSIGVISARPGRGATGILVQDTAGGTVARWLLPATLLGPFLIGAIGLALERAGYYGFEFTVALVTVANLSLFSALVWLLAVHLHRTDARRLSAEAELRRINAELEEGVRARTRELAASEEQYRRLIEESAAGILIHRQGVIRVINAAALRMLAYRDPADLVGQPVMRYIAPEHRETVEARVAARLRGEPTPATVEMEGLRPDGSRFWIEATATVVEWEGGPATLVFFIDISERRRREAAERQAENLLSVTKLANAAAHEINNPLTVVGGHLQLLAAKVADRPELRRHFEQGEQAVQRIAEMIGHMTRITRLELLKSLETGGVETLDLRRSSEPTAGGDRAGGKGETP
jgi:PAS domain S-box-containing protein